VSRRTFERITSLGSDDRGLWTPSHPLAITLVLLVTIGFTAAYVSLAATNPLGVREEEVTIEFDDSVVNDDGSVVVTVVGERTGDPVEGVTVIPTSESVSLVSTPERTTDKTGKVRFEFGNTEDDIDIDWPTGEQLTTVTFEIEHPDEGYVDRRSNSDLTVKRTKKGVKDSASKTKVRENSAYSGRDRSVSGEWMTMLPRFPNDERTRFDTISFQ